jgi:MHS family proline/betaine transporter-like MFS transporter
MPPAPSGLTRTVIAGAIGNVLEWYDFGLFGFFAPIIAQQFLPTEDRLASLIGTFGIFAAGFLMRPLGGVLFGWIGDRLGRRQALTLSVLVMASSTTLLGLLPTHAQIGLAAPVLLTLMRLLQGVSVGGEYIGSMSFLAEHAPFGRRAFLSSWSSFGAVLGTLLGSGTAALFDAVLSDTQLAVWGWRIPFLAGSVIGLSAWRVRQGLSESPSFLKTQQAGGLAANPLREVLKHNLGGILTTVGLTTVASVGFYIPFVWLPTWLSQIEQPPLPEKQALIANTIALVALLLLTPFAALLADRVGNKPVYMASALGYVLLSYPVFVLMRDGTMASAVLAGLTFALCSSLSSGCAAAVLAELFPTRTRYTGVAIGYNLAQSLMGGTAPLAATAMIQFTGDETAPAFYLIAGGLLAGAACLFIRARHGQPLE